MSRRGQNENDRFRSLCSNFSRIQVAKWTQCRSFRCSMRLGVRSGALFDDLQLVADVAGLPAADFSAIASCGSAIGRSIALLEGASTSLARWLVRGQKACIRPNITRSTFYLQFRAAGNIARQLLGSSHNGSRKFHDFLLLFFFGTSNSKTLDYATSLEGFTDDICRPLTFDMPSAIVNLLM